MVMHKDSNVPNNGAFAVFLTKAHKKSGHFFPLFLKYGSGLNAFSTKIPDLGKHFYRLRY